MHQRSSRLPLGRGEPCHALLDFNRGILRRESLPVAQWPEFRALTGRLAGAIASETENPYFAVHEGVSGATARVRGRELLNFSSYNYLGLSGHPEVTLAAQQGTLRAAALVLAVERAPRGRVARDDHLVVAGNNLRAIAEDLGVRRRGCGRDCWAWRCC